MKTSRVASSSGLLLVVLAANLSAQDELPLELGDRVRISAPTIQHDPFVGTVVSMDVESWSLDVEGRTELLVLPLNDMKKLEVSHGSTSRAGRGAIIGGSIGFVVGAVLGYGLIEVVNLSNESGGDVSSVLGAAVGGVIVALPGAGIGALIGSLNKVDRWEDVPLDRIHVVFGVNDKRGFTVSASLRF